MLRAPVRDGFVYFKACRPIQAFEPELTLALASRWPDLAPEVLAVDPGRSWLLTADAGAPIADIGNPPERWLEVLPRYAELQRGELQHARELPAMGVPDMRPDALPAQFDALLHRRLPLDAVEVEDARRLRPRLQAMIRELTDTGIGNSIEHADLHLRSVFIREGHLRVLDWGDASVGHPFASLVVTFAVLREINGLAPDDPWFDRLRDAYLEPWGSGLVPAFDLAVRIGAVTRAIGWGRHWEAMGAGAFPAFDEQFPGVLRTAFAALRTTLPA